MEVTGGSHQHDTRHLHLARQFHRHKGVFILGGVESATLRGKQAGVVLRFIPLGSRTAPDQAPFRCQLTGERFNLGNAHIGVLVTGFVNHLRDGLESQAVKILLCGQNGRRQQLDPLLGSHVATLADTRDDSLHQLGIALFIKLGTQHITPVQDSGGILTVRHRSAQHISKEIAQAGGVLISPHSSELLRAELLNAPAVRAHDLDALPELHVGFLELLGLQVLSQPVSQSLVHVLRGQLGIKRHQILTKSVIELIPVGGAGILGFFQHLAPLTHGHIVARLGLGCLFKAVLCLGQLPFIGIDTTENPQHMGLPRILLLRIREKLRRGMQR